MIHKDFWGRCTSSSSGTEAKVYAKSVELCYTDSGRTVHCTAHCFAKRSEIRWDAYIVPTTGDRFFEARNINFTKHQPIHWESGERKEEETAMHGPDPCVGTLIMVKKYRIGKPENGMTPVVLVLAAILLFVILFIK